MATIELYKSKINNMSNYINQAKSAVGDFCVDLSALKSKVLGIKVKCRMRVPFVTQESLFVNENLIL